MPGYRCGNEMLTRSAQRRKQPADADFNGGNIARSVRCTKYHAITGTAASCGRVAPFLRLHTAASWRGKCRTPVGAYFAATRPRRFHRIIEHDHFYVKRHDDFGLAKRRP